MEEQPEPIAGLIRDHRVIEEVVGRAREAIAAAAARPNDAGLIAHGIEQLRDLDAFAAVDLTLHIAKEEQVLFPALRARAEAVVADMLAQHDEVRDRNAKVRQVLAAIDSHHDDVRAQTANLSDSLQSAAPEAVSPALLSTLYETVKTLDWILQGHFLDEEDNLFEPALAWFTADAFADLARSMATLDRLSDI